ncbi:unnamed protein product [Pedinophyceae sp. YPF-701]|nr:unnamed protein product [Pedinophyceae sp. YPF-701]
MGGKSSFANALHGQLAALRGALAEQHDNATLLSFMLQAEAYPNIQREAARRAYCESILAFLDTQKHISEGRIPPPPSVPPETPREDSARPSPRPLPREADLPSLPGMRIVYWDLETTGIGAPDADLASWDGDCIIEVAGFCPSANDEGPFGVYASPMRIRDGCRLSEGAAATNHFSEAELAAPGVPKAKEALAGFVDWLEDRRKEAEAAGEVPVLVAHNGLRFDLPRLAASLRVEGLDVGGLSRWLHVDSFRQVLQPLQSDLLLPSCSMDTLRDHYSIHNIPGQPHRAENDVRALDAVLNAALSALNARRAAGGSAALTLPQLLWTCAYRNAFPDIAPLAPAGLDGACRLPREPQRVLDAHFGRPMAVDDVSARLARVSLSPGGAAGRSQAESEAAAGRTLLGGDGAAPMAHPLTALLDALDAAAGDGEVAALSAPVTVLGAGRGGAWAALTRKALQEGLMSVGDVLHVLPRRYDEVSGELMQAVRNKTVWSGRGRVVASHVRTVRGRGGGAGMLLLTLQVEVTRGGDAGRLIDVQVWRGFRSQAWVAKKLEAERKELAPDGCTVDIEARMEEPHPHFNNRRDTSTGLSPAFAVARASSGIASVLRMVLPPGEPDTDGIAGSVEQTDPESGGGVSVTYPKRGQLEPGDMRTLVDGALEFLVQEVAAREEGPGAVDPLPTLLAAQLESSGVCGADMSTLRAWHAVHRPKDLRDSDNARRRLALQELYVQQLALALSRRAMQAHALATGGGALWLDRALPKDATAALESILPYDLTRGQREALSEVVADMLRPDAPARRARGDDAPATPMYRLLQGDVGCGKTAVAFLAMLLVAASGHQAALMAPTDLLARQHHDNFLKLLARLDERLASADSGAETAALRRMFPNGAPRVALFAATLPADQRRAAAAAIATGDAGIAIGTHALVSKGTASTSRSDSESDSDSGAGRTAFAALALSVIDEQHKFGVRQRALLASGDVPSSSGRDTVVPHVLCMSATPIPRTLAAVQFGDMDVSAIRELPPGRQPVATTVLEEGAAQTADTLAAEIRGEIKRGGQVYVVFPQIGTADAADGAASGTAIATVEAERAALEASGALGRRAKILAVHGRMPPEERRRALDAFRTGECNVLLASTVVETGVDVPNASLMIVRSADRFGLASLHQLRGRVGRGGRESRCLVVGGVGPDGGAVERLRVLEQTGDGWEVAEADLRARGAGAVIGTRQSGASVDLRIARLPEDEVLLMHARGWATEAVVGLGGVLGGPAAAVRALATGSAARAALAETVRELIRSDREPL